MPKKGALAKNAQEGGWSGPSRHRNSTRAHTRAQVVSVDTAEKEPKDLRKRCAKGPKVEGSRKTPTGQTTERRRQYSRSYVTWEAQLCSQHRLWRPCAAKSTPMAAREDEEISDPKKF